MFIKRPSFHKLMLSKRFDFEASMFLFRFHFSFWLKSCNLQLFSEVKKCINMLFILISFSKENDVAGRPEKFPTAGSWTGRVSLKIGSSLCGSCQKKPSRVWPVRVDLFFGSCFFRVDPGGRVYKNGSPAAYFNKISTYIFRNLI